MRIAYICHVLTHPQLCYRWGSGQVHYKKALRVATPGIEFVPVS